jgi:hypothetical protein
MLRRSIVDEVQVLRRIESKVASTRVEWDWEGMNVNRMKRTVV